MKCYVGIDLGSTTSKAVVMDAAGEVLGRGITNSRSNYETATRVSKLEAFTSTRLTLLRRALAEVPQLKNHVDPVVAALERNFRLGLTLEQLVLPLFEGGEVLAQTFLALHQLVQLGKNLFAHQLVSAVGAHSLAILADSTPVFKLLS